MTTTYALVVDNVQSTASSSPFATVLLGLWGKSVSSLVLEKLPPTQLVMDTAHAQFRELWERRVPKQSALAAKVSWDSLANWHVLRMSRVISAVRTVPVC
jgi:hypothetical protein